MSLADRPVLDARRILRELVARGVDFVVIGGIAAVLQGSARTTYDLDVCFAPDEANLGALSRVLADLHARLRDVPAEVVWEPDAQALGQIETLTLRTDAGDVDLLARPAGAPGYARLREGADRFDLGGFAVLVAGLDDLMAMKRAAGRVKDQADLAELQVLRRLRGAG